MVFRKYIKSHTHQTPSTQVSTHTQQTNPSHVIVMLKSRNHPSLSTSTSTEKGQASPAKTSSIPPITNRGCVGVAGAKTPALKLCIDDRDPSPTPRSPALISQNPTAADAGAVGAGSTGLGSSNPNPCRSIASSSHRERSSLSARSIFDGRRRSRKSRDDDGRRRGLARLKFRRKGLWLRLRLRSSVVVVFREVSILLSCWEELAGSQAGRHRRLNGDVGDDAGDVVAELSGLTVEQSLRA